MIESIFLEARCCIPLTPFADLKRLLTKLRCVREEEIILTNLSMIAPRET